jgi:2-oxoglutarate ferredoxin oxidoreductase subunit delta
MPKVSFDEDLCKGCGLCVGACPKKIVAITKEKMNAKGFHPARLTNADECIACGFCAVMCPDVAIRVEK